MLVLLAVTAATLVAVQSGPSTDTAGGAAGRATVALQMTVNRPDPPLTARLTCRGRSATARGYLRRRPVTACRTARRNAGFLASRPSATQICTENYGGPETARIRGTIGARSIDRRFARRNGCEISDWDRAGALLPRVPRAP